MEFLPILVEENKSKVFLGLSNLRYESHFPWKSLENNHPELNSLMADHIPQTFYSLVVCFFRTGSLVLRHARLGGVV